MAKSAGLSMTLARDGLGHSKVDDILCWQERLQDLRGVGGVEGGGDLL